MSRSLKKALLMLKPDWSACVETQPLATSCIAYVKVRGSQAKIFWPRRVAAPVLPADLLGAVRCELTPVHAAAFHRWKDKENPRKAGVQLGKCREWKLPIDKLSIGVTVPDTADLARSEMGTVLMHRTKAMSDWAPPIPK